MLQCRSQRYNEEKPRPIPIRRGFSFHNGQLFEKIDNDIHVGLRRDSAAQICVNDTATRFDGGIDAELFKDHAGTGLL
jgi:hypothetical protein